MSDLNSVNVALRVRPLVSSEKLRGCQAVLKKVDGENQVLVNNTEAFSFNYVFDWHDTQEQVYKASVYHLLDKLFCGFNVTILAYGQTGSGKTHTMGTAFDDSLNENLGIIPRAINDIFERIQNYNDKFDFVVKCSFMELYQEQFYDLLSNKSRNESVVDMRENRSGIKLVNLTEKKVQSAVETTNCLVRGSTGRAVASTAMNYASSRSHAIFTVTLEATSKDSSHTVTTSKFRLVDLAGSERSKKTGSTGDRFKEGVKINQGLLALGNVISALGERKSVRFVPYRDSKLTRLLQDSLGGNSFTLMIACVSPADYNVAETLSTLRYADRARKIKNKPIVNQDPHVAEINRLKGIIQLLTKSGTMTASLLNELEKSNSVTTDEHNRKYQELQEKYQNLQQQYQMTLIDVTVQKTRADIAQAAYENIKQKAAEIKLTANELSQIKKILLNKEKLENTIKHVTNIVHSLNEEVSRAETKIRDYKRRICLGSIIRSAEQKEFESNNISMPETNNHMQERTETFISNQITGSFRKLSIVKDDAEVKFKEYEQKIEELKAENSELLDKLRHIKKNAFAKLAEERRKRIQALQQEFSEMKRKSTQQDKLLKIKEHESKKIKNLNREIQVLKESNVRLVKEMRSEAENFKQFKIASEREIMLHRNKEQKLLNEMARKEALHNKQHSILNRKCEEAMAINKKLKHALERQQLTKSERQKMQYCRDATAASTKINQVIACVKCELGPTGTVTTNFQFKEKFKMLTAKISKL